MAAAFTLLTPVTDSTTNTTVYTTPSVSPASSLPVYVGVHNSKATTPNIATITGLGLTWTRITGLEYESGLTRIDWYEGVGTVTSGAVTATFAANQTGCQIMVGQVTDATPSGAVVQAVTGSGASGATPSITLAAFSSVNNITIGWFGSGGATSSWTAGSGFTIPTDGTVEGVTPSRASAIEYKLSNDTTVDITRTGGTSAAWGGIAVEISIVVGTTHDAAATVAGTSTVTVSTVVDHYVDAAAIVNGVSTITVEARTDVRTTVAVDSVSSVSASPSLLISASVNIDGTSTVDINPVVDVAVIADPIDEGAGRYRVVVSHLYHTGLGKIEEVEVKNLVFTKILNAPGSISFTVPIYDPKCTPEIFKPGARELQVYRNDVLVWGGYLWTAHREGGGGDEASGGTINMRFGGEGWLSRLKKRRLKVDKTYTAQDIYDIAWDYINYTQQRTHGDLGFTRFSLALRGETQTLAWKAYERKMILELIQQLAESDQGFDFEVTPEREWKTYERMGNPVPKIFELGYELKNNVKNYTYEIDAISKMATEFTLAGKGEKELKLFSTQTDAIMSAEYGLLEEIESNTDIDDQGILDSICALLLRMYKEPRQDLHTYVTLVDPAYGTYGIGDAVTVRVNDGFTQFDRDMRIKTMVTSVPNVGDETVGVFYDEVYV